MDTVSWVFLELSIIYLLCAPSFLFRYACTAASLHTLFACALICALFSPLLYAPLYLLFYMLRSISSVCPALFLLLVRPRTSNADGSSAHKWNNKCTNPTQVHKCVFFFYYASSSPLPSSLDLSSSSGTAAAFLLLSSARTTTWVGLRALSFCLGFYWPSIGRITSFSTFAGYMHASSPAHPIPGSFKCLLFLSAHQLTYAHFICAKWAICSVCLFQWQQIISLL